MPDSTTSPEQEGDFEISPGLHADLVTSVRDRLTQDRPEIPPRFLYDELGSRLFEVITAVPDYYPTRTEAAIWRDHMAAITAARPVAGCTMIDLGAGNCQKAASLFDAVEPASYLAVDVSAEFLEEALARLRLKFPRIEMMGYGADFFENLELPELPQERRLFFYPGSSIGNFTRDGAVQFLRSIRAQMRADSTLWITADLDKDPAVLERAYDDELGVTAAFNKNSLYHLNEVAGTDFRIPDWRHVAFYDRDKMRIEMHLEAVRDVTVSWPGGSREFAKGSRMHTENSHKNTIATFDDLLRKAGLQTVQHWTDERDWVGFFVAAPA